MPCKHKFHEFLTLERIDFDPTVLVVGTFNPQWPNENGAEWFYGRVRNNYFWDVLPRIYETSLNLRRAMPSAWKEFCSIHTVAITDLISCICDAESSNEEHQDILSNYLDTSIADYFESFEFTRIVELLKKYPSIKSVYLTRQRGIPLFDAKWSEVEQYGRDHDLHVRNLLTPSASARFQIHDYRQAHPSDKTPLRNFIYHSWRQEWHER